MTTPTPEQVAQWRKEAIHAWISDSTVRPSDAINDTYVRGYLLAKAQMLDQPAGEPVAMRYKDPNDKRWQLCNIQGSELLHDGLVKEPLYIQPPAPLKMLDDDEFQKVWIECSDPQQDEIVMSEFSEKIQQAFCTKNNLPLEKL